MRFMLFIIVVAVTTYSGELTLKDAQRLLEKNNFDLRQNSEDIKKSDAEISEAKSFYYPSLDGSASFNYVTERSKVKIVIPPNPPLTSTSGQKDRTEFGLDLSYPFFTGLSRYYNVKGKEISKSVKEQNRRVIFNRYSYALGVLYLRWNLACNQLEVRKKSIEQMDLYTRQMRMLNEGGVVVTSRVLEAQAKLKSAQLDYILTKDQIDSLKLELMGMIGIKDSLYTPQTGSFSFDSVQIPSEVSLTRAEIQALDKTIQQLEYSSKQINSQRYPVITGAIGYRVGDPGLDVGTGKFMDYFQFGSQLKLNIYNGMKFRAQRTAIQHQIEMSRIEKEKNIDSWNRSIDLWKMQINSADEKIAVAKASMEAQAELVNSLDQSLKGGVVTDVDFETSVTGYSQAGLSLEQALFAKRLAILNALFSSGKDIVF